MLWPAAERKERQHHGCLGVFVARPSSRPRPHARRRPPPPSGPIPTRHSTCRPAIQQEEKWKNTFLSEAIFLTVSSPPLTPSHLTIISFRLSTRLSFSLSLSCFQGRTRNWKYACDIMCSDVPNASPLRKYNK